MKFLFLLILSCVTTSLAIDDHGKILCRSPKSFCGKSDIQYSCCSKTQKCAQGVCCSPGAPLNNRGACCSRSCGHVCCDNQGANYVCANATRGLCCPSGQVDINGYCVPTLASCKAQGFTSNCSPLMPCTGGGLCIEEGCCELPPK